MHRRKFLLVSALSPLAALAAEAPPEPRREFRGAWVASVFNLNWPSRAALPVAEQKRELRALLDRAVTLRLNAIVLQVRPSSDALYPSKIEPWSAFLTGKMGLAPEPLYDPLEFAVAEAHARGLELHAWVNPFRALATPSGGVDAHHITRTHPEWTRRYGAQSFLDPGVPAAREYVLGVIRDIVRRYDIDGLHIDDYFYPYPLKDKSPFPDAPTFQRYQAAKGALSLGDWRRDNINRFVQAAYQAIKEEKRWVKFGVSPFGIWRPGIPESTIAFLDSYNHLFADSRRWLNEGWCDYFSPQLYWSIDPPAQSFPVLLQWWRGENSQGRHLWPGIAPERIGSARPASEITRQIELTRAPQVTGPGVVHWEMKSLLQNRGGIGKLLLERCYQETALVPASPWLARQAGPPGPPKLSRRGGVLEWQPSGETAPRWWAVQSKGSGWTLQVLPGSETSLPLAPETKAVAVRAIDAYGNSSAPTVFTL